MDSSPDDGAGVGVAVADVVECAQGRSNTEIAASLAVSWETVRKWRSRFVRDRLEGLADEARPGALRKITDEQVERVITATLEHQPPRGDTHWSTRSMATTLGMSQSAISRIWRAFGLEAASGADVEAVCNSSA